VPLTHCLVILNIPTMFTLSYSKSAAKALAKMPRKIAGSMQAELRKIAANPATYRGDWKPLQGSPFWRLRSGSYRAICEVRDKELHILVLKIGSRGDVYK
jgi:mRNA interferase RelE/StbE